MHTHSNTHIHLRINMYMYVCMYSYMFMYTHTHCIHIYLYCICLRAIYKHIYAYIQCLNWIVGVEGAVMNGVRCGLRFYKNYDGLFFSLYLKYTFLKNILPHWE